MKPEGNSYRKFPNMSKPTADELKDKPDEVRRMVAVLRGYSYRDEGHRYPDEPEWQRFKAVYNGDGFVGLEKPGWTQVPNWTGSHDACRTFLKALSVEEASPMHAALWRIATRKQCWTWQLEPIDFCIAFLIVKGAINA